MDFGDWFSKGDKSKKTKRKLIIFLSITFILITHAP